MESVYRAWAPEGAAWSAWAKPAVFSGMNAMGAPVFDEELPAVDAEWMGRADGSSAMVVDLPGAVSVAMGVEAARRGFRAVPMYNGLPGMPGARVVVDVWPIARALVRGAGVLEELRVPEHAPPAFVLDVRRRGEGAAVKPEMFDNRSISLPGDFPSAAKLMSSGVRRVIVVQERYAEPRSDLNRTLWAWQEAGIEIHMRAMDSTGPAKWVRVRRPMVLLGVWHAVLASVGLRRGAFGGYGGYVPHPSSGG